MDPTMPAIFTPTESVGNVGEITAAARASRMAGTPTEDDVIGPYYRAGAPFRAKISPPMASGNVLLIAGSIWSFRRRRPISNCVLDVWQADAEGHYDNEDPTQPPSRSMFQSRARLLSGEHGGYELETILPGPYQMDATTWRSPHLHFLVRAVGFKTLITQLFFEGSPYLDTDPFVKPSLIIKLADQSGDVGNYKRGVFQIVLDDDIEPTV